MDKEAFEKARAAYGTGAYDDATLEFLFPQLKESEDERIIKLIRSLLENARNVQSNTSLYKQYDDALAWIEKQKGQNSPDSTGLYYYDGKKFTCCGFPYNFTMNQQEEQKTVAISENNDSDANGHLTGKILVEYGAHAKVRDGKRHCEMDWKEFQRLAHYFYELGKTEQKPVVIQVENPNIQKLDPNVIIETRTNGTGEPYREPIPGVKKVF